jgi:hypothetical protein
MDLRSQTSAPAPPTTTARRGSQKEIADDPVCSVRGEGFRGPEASDAPEVGGISESDERALGDGVLPGPWDAVVPA